MFLLHHRAIMLLGPLDLIDTSVLSYLVDHHLTTTAGKEALSLTCKRAARATWDTVKRVKLDTDTLDIQHDGEYHDDAPLSFPYAEELYVYMGDSPGGHAQGPLCRVLSTLVDPARLHVVEVVCLSEHHQVADALCFLQWLTSGLHGNYSLKRVTVRFVNGGDLMASNNLVFLAANSDPQALVDSMLKAHTELSKIFNEKYINKYMHRDRVNDFFIDIFKEYVPDCLHIQLICDGSAHYDAPDCTIPQDEENIAVVPGLDGLRTIVQNGRQYPNLAILTLYNFTLPTSKTDFELLRASRVLMPGLKTVSLSDKRRWVDDFGWDESALVKGVHGVHALKEIFDGVEMELSLIVSDGTVERTANTILNHVTLYATEDFMYEEDVWGEAEFCFKRIENEFRRAPPHLNVTRIDLRSFCIEVREAAIVSAQDALDLLDSIARFAPNLESLVVYVGSTADFDGHEWWDSELFQLTMSSLPRLKKFEFLCWEQNPEYWFSMWDVDRRRRFLRVPSSREGDNEKRILQEKQLIAVKRLATTACPLLHTFAYGSCVIDGVTIAESRECSIEHLMRLW